MKKSIETKFYKFRQNNTGGTLYVSDKNGIDEYVIIEAVDSEHANIILQQLGAYFDGVKNKRDCKCCGDRWTRTTEEDAIEIEELDESVTAYEYVIYKSTYYIHYLDKTIKKIVK